MHLEHGYALGLERPRNSSIYPLQPYSTTTWLYMGGEDMSTPDTQNELVNLEIVQHGMTRFIEHSDTSQRLRYR